MTHRGQTPGTETADVIVMAASAIETVRLALLSGFPDRSGKLGRRLMLHAFVDGSAIFLDERMHAHAAGRCPSARRTPPTRTTRAPGRSRSSTACPISAAA